MTLTPGTRLGVYEISTQIGEGGMGQVFRATDTRLKRQVAIKILPPALAADAERLTRFQREAEVLASLNHPNIAGIYGLEEGGGITALVMELVEGEDLSQRIARGAISVDDALPIAKQIAEALEAAHERAIIHRDLKPANIKVRPDGTVKVLDFGLAKALAPAAAGATADASMSPTITSHPEQGRGAMTQAGMILGTAAYMSPEQARGTPVDKRADIWAFGVVLYEMLSGTRLFDGESMSDVIAAVLTRDPDWTKLPASTPPGLVRLLRRCLERDPRKRLHDIADAHFDLRDSTEPPAPAGGAAGVRLTTGWLVGAGVLAVLSVAAGGFAVRQLDRTPAPTPIHFAVALPVGEDVLQQASGVAISPDGTRIVSVGSQDGQRGLFLRSFDDLEARLIPGSDFALAPFFSPDGQWLAFFSAARGTRGAQLTKIKIDGGAPIRVGDTASSALGGYTASGSWSESGQILFSGASPTIQRVSSSGGPASAATALDASRGEQSHVQPRWLPGGRALIYVANVAGGRQDVMLGSGDSGKGRVLVEGGTSPRFVLTGHLLFVREKTLLAAPFDLQKLELTGEPFAVVEALSVSAFGDYRAAAFDVSQNGTLAYLIDKPSTRSGQLVFVDRQGKATAAFEERGMYLAPRLSLDGGHIVYAAIDAQSGQRNIWIGDVKRGTRTRLTLGTGTFTDPIWTPDGQGITYASIQEQGSFVLFTSPTDGSRESSRLTGSLGPNRSLFPRAWLRDGSGLIFQAIGTSDDIGIWQKSSGAEEMLLDTAVAEQEPSLSPDERFIAYVSNESGPREVYIRALRGAAHRVQVSNDGGDEPVWSPRGTEIFYRRGAQMIAVPVSTSSDVTLGRPTVLFEGRYDVDPFNNDNANYDVSQDGQRFVMVRPVADPARSLQQLNVVVNWHEELKRLAPSK